MSTWSKDTISDLQAVRPAHGDVAVVAGYRTPGDHGGGIFRWEGRAPPAATLIGFAHVDVAISKASNETPIVVTTMAPHGYISGQQVVIDGVTGNLGANGTWTIKRLDDKSFSLDGSRGSGISGGAGVAHTTHVSTAGDHALATDQQVMIAGVGTRLVIDGLWRVTVVTPRVFAIGSKQTTSPAVNGVIGDGGTSIPSSMQPGRWFRLRVGVLNVREFGAHGDGSTDDATAIRGAIMADPGTLFFPPGVYRIGSYLEIPARVPVQFTDGAVLSPAGAQVRILGPILAADSQQIFSGTGVCGAAVISGNGPPIWATATRPLGPCGNLGTNPRRLPNDPSEWVDSLAGRMMIRIIEGGGLMSARFQYLVDNGGDNIWSRTQTVDSNFEIPGAGVVIEFSTGTYEAGTIYQWWTRAPIYLGPRAASTLHPGWWGADEPSTDVTLAIQSALQAARSREGGVVQLGAGKYLISASLRLPIGVSLRGLGVDATAISYSTPAGAEPADMVVCGNALNIGSSRSSAVEGLRLVHMSLVIGGMLRWRPGSHYSAGQYSTPKEPANILLRCIQGGTSGACTPLGQLTPPKDIRLDGTPNGICDIRLRATQEGKLGELVFQVSLDGGATWGADVVTIAASSFDYVIPGTGYTLRIPQTSGSWGTAGLTPYPPVVLGATPTHELSAYQNSAFDIAVTAGGALGQMRFRTIRSGNFGQGIGTVSSEIVSEGVDIHGNPLSSWTYTDSETGLTVTFYSGGYPSTAAGGYLYHSPSFGWSMIPGTVIQDGTCRWEVVPGPCCIADVHGGSLSFRSVACIGGVAGICLEQSQSVTIAECAFTGQLMAGLWICSGGERSFGAESGHTNNIACTGSTFAGGAGGLDITKRTGGNPYDLSGYGVVDDGGLQHCIGAGSHFEGNSKAWAYISNASSLLVSGCYIEDRGGLASNSLLNSRRAASFGFQSFSFHGNYANSKGLPVLSLWTGSGLSVIGNQFTRVPVAFTCSYVVDVTQSANTEALRVFDAPYFSSSGAVT